MNCPNCGHKQEHPSKRWRQKRRDENRCIGCSHFLEGDDIGYSRCSTCREAKKLEQRAKRKM